MWDHRASQPIVILLTPAFIFSRAKQPFSLTLGDLSPLVILPGFISAKVSSLLFLPLRLTGGYRSDVHLFFMVHRALNGSAGPAISYLSRGWGWFACAFLFCGSYGINYYLMATPGPRPFACLSCEKDLEEPTSGFDCCNCRLIE